MKKIVLAIFVLLFSSKVWASEIPNFPAEIALAKLKDGNTRFVKEQMKHLHQSKAYRMKLVNGQHPFAVVICCSDSRVAPEVIFDQGLGDIFVIRNAGNIIDEHVLGSIEYAVYHLGVNLVIVMGHESCGEVGAAMKGDKELPDIESIKESILPAVKKCKESSNYSYNNVIKTNAKLNAEEILNNDAFKDRCKKHDFEVVPAYYSISTGEVEILKLDE